MSVSDSSPPAPGGGLFSAVGRDLPAGLVVFLVAVPLCLGIAQASGAPLLSGLIAGMVGGLVISMVSQSALSVSGPAAGLAVIVAAGIVELGFRPFLMAVVIAGVLQLGFGLLRLGAIAHLFPTAVIKGMLASIGILITLKQLPHAVGYDRDFEGDDAFFQADGHNTFSSLIDAFGAFTPAAIIVTVACVVVYLVWPKLQRGPLKLIPPALVAVVVGGVIATVLPGLWAGGALAAEHLVALPSFTSIADVGAAIVVPDFGSVTNPKVWATALTLCIVASIETLLSLEAIDRLDPDKRISPPNRELVAQGIGNMVSGLIGGLPVTAVIVRSSANLQAGGKTRLSAMVHGVLILIGVLFLAPILNKVPLAALAVVLIFVGTKLAPPSLFRSMWRGGWSQFVPFMVTIVAVVFTDLLKGTLVGLAVGIVFAVRAQQRNAVSVVADGDHLLIRFAKDQTFLNKATLKSALADLTPGTTVILDRGAADFIDDDVEELIMEFVQAAPGRGLIVEEVGVTEVVEATRRRLGGAPAH